MPTGIKTHFQNITLTSLVTDEQRNGQMDRQEHNAGLTWQCRAELYCHPPRPQVADGGAASRYRG